MRDLLGATGHPASALPADEQVAAFYSNAVSPVSRLSVEQYRDVAERIASAAVMGSLESLTGCGAAAQDATCAEGFFQRIGRRAFSRPLTDEELGRYRGLFEKNQARGFGEGIRVALQTLLQSPSFLYHLELAPAQAGTGVAPLSGFELSGRLSFALWNSVPDDDLLDAAARGELDGVSGLTKQAERLLASDRAKDALGSFHLQWLGLDGLLDIDKDPQLFPSFTPALQTQMRDEVVSFADFVIRRGDGRLQTLLSAPFTVASPDLLKLYGATAVSGADGTTALDPNQRAGLLTQAAFLSAHSHANQTSPVHRGLAVRKNLLCTDLPDPPANVNNNPPAPDPNATTRQRFEQHRTNPTCAACHQLLEPIGVGFENYDAIGAYRTQENGLAVDARGEVTGAPSTNGPFEGAVALAQRLSTSPEVRTCIQKQWFRFALGRLEGGDDTCSLAAVDRAFAARDFNVKELLLALVTSDAFRYRREAP